MFFRNIRPITTEHELIRLGEKSNGGYLVPNDLIGITACFLPGVSAEVSRGRTSPQKHQIIYGRLLYRITSDS